MDHHLHIKYKTIFSSTMRYIQVYLIISKKTYSGRVTHTLSQQKVSIISEKPLPKIWNCVRSQTLKSCALAVQQFTLPLVILSEWLWSPHTAADRNLHLILSGQAALTDWPLFFYKRELTRLKLEFHMTLHFTKYSLTSQPLKQVKTLF